MNASFLSGKISTTVSVFRWRKFGADASRVTALLRGNFSRIVAVEAIIRNETKYNRELATVRIGLNLPLMCGVIGTAFRPFGSFPWLKDLSIVVPLQSLFSTIVDGLQSLHRGRSLGR